MHRTLMATAAPASTWLIRLMVGAVFVSEGLQKFLFPDSIGAGRFARIGLPAPEMLALFVGSVETLAGTAMLVGVWTRVAAVPLIVTMLVALASTKWPILMERGFWAAAHEARTDWSMLLGCVFLLINGAGPWSVDHRVSARPRVVDR